MDIISRCFELRIVVLVINAIGEEICLHQCGAILGTYNAGESVAGTVVDVDRVNIAGLCVFRYLYGDLGNNAVGACVIAFNVHKVILVPAFIGFSVFTCVECGTVLQCRTLLDAEFSAVLVNGYLKTAVHSEMCCECTVFTIAA